jgi:UDP-N-acetylmuramate dehydrogenase
MSAHLARLGRRKASQSLEAAAARLGRLARRNEPIGALTTYRVGGKASLFVEIDGEPVLEQVAQAVSETGVEVLVLGCGSNLLVADEGFAGLCVRLGGSFDQVRLDADDGKIVAGGAVRYPALARRAAAEGIAGLGFAVGIPGSVGGAVRMNAGGHGQETVDRLVRARVVDLTTGEASWQHAGELGLGYRRSRLCRSDLVVEAELAGEPGADPAKLAAELSGIVAWRRAHQPGGRNAGSVFTNPEGDSAGRLVEEAGCKGLRLGTAMVSDKHANFIQADAHGSADDVRRLIEEVRRLVLARIGVELEVELKMVGFS